MEPKIEQHFREIYGNSLSDNLLMRIIQHIDSFLNIHHNSLLPHTESERTGYILNWNGTEYFSIVHIARKKPVVLAGALEKRNDNKKVAAIRFFEDNPSLRDVPIQYQFPYRKPGWTNVELAEETIDLLPALFNSQVHLYNERYISKR